MLSKFVLLSHEIRHVLSYDICLTSCRACIKYLKEIILPPPILSLCLHTVYEDRIGKTLSEKLASSYETINEKIKETNEKNVSIPDEIDQNYKSFNETINEKIKETNEKNVSIPDEIDQNNKSFKDVVRKNIPAASTPPNMREIITEDRNEQLIRGRERKRRAMNVIIHGVNESTEEDKEYVKELSIPSQLYVWEKILIPINAGRSRSNLNIAR